MFLVTRGQLLLSTCPNVLANRLLKKKKKHKISLPKTHCSEKKPENHFTSV